VIGLFNRKERKERKKITENIAREDANFENVLLPLRLRVFAG
jgi:hypothetical protein